MWRLGIVLGVVVAGMLGGAKSADAQTINLLETASLGPQGHSGGLLLSASHSVGTRFTTTRTHRITRLRISAAVRQNVGNKQLFIALAPLTAVNGFPVRHDLNDSVFNTLFTTPEYLTREINIATDFQLPAGSYAFIAGFGLFGATGEGIAGASNPPIGPQRYFSRDEIGFTEQSYSSVRFVVEGEPMSDAPAVPEPGALALFLPALGVIAVLRRRRS